MARISNRAFDWRHALAALAVTLLPRAGPAGAAIPAPANDTPATAEVIGALPALIYGTTVGANDTITTIPEIAAITALVDGPDVYYKFTPSTSGTYRFQVAPWQLAPLRSSDYRFTVYLFEEQDSIYLAGKQAPGSARPVFLDVALNANTDYIFGVDADNSTSDRDNWPFTLLVENLTTLPAAPDTCATAVTLSSTLPAVAVRSIDGAAGDYTFAAGTGRCSIATSSTAAGIDHVYHFVPSADGDYAIDLIFDNFDAVLYVADSCPNTGPGCMGAANHSSGGTSGGKHEFVVVTLEADKDYYIFVDTSAAGAATGTYALIINSAAAYEITEVEPNNNAATASAYGAVLDGGQLLGSTDEDWWAIPGSINDRVYAWANNGGTTNSTLDTEMSFYAANGTTLIEYDDEDGDGIDAPINDFYFIYSTDSPVIAGAKLSSTATHYLRVFDTSATGTVHKYRMHVGTEPGTRTPYGECNPNDSIALADRSGKLYFSGSIDTVTDRDVYALDLVAGDKVFLAVDGDPERDSPGNVTANSDPLAFHALIRVLDPDGDVLISDISDANSPQTGGGDFPGQAGYFWAKESGTHYLEVGPQSALSQVGPTETYNLAVFVNGERGNSGIEDNDPNVTLTPDYALDFITLDADDNEPGDSGICSVELVGNTNLQIVGSFSPPVSTVGLVIDLIDESTNGSAKVVVTDCEGNTFCSFVSIDVFNPVCDGVEYSTRVRNSQHDALHVPNNDVNGTTNGVIVVDEPGIITRFNSVTVTIDAPQADDIDLFLISPSGTQVELMTDRGSSLAIDYKDTTFTDSAAAIVSTSSSDAPWTGNWKPEDPQGLAKLIGEQAQGTWKLKVIDDDSNESFGATLAKWSISIDAAFAGPEVFAGRTTDFGDGGGIADIELTSGTNVLLNTTGFVPGDQDVDYMVTLIDTSTDGTAVITVTDLAFNTCQEVINLSGLADNSGPSSAGSVTTDLTVKKEVQLSVPDHAPPVTSTITIPDSFPVGEVEVALHVDALDQGRVAATLTHNGDVAVLVNRIAMDERGALGNVKVGFDVLLDDDAPQSKDIHLEPALGTLATLGTYQPDGRGDFIGDAATSDPRHNMLFVFSGTDAQGAWDLSVGDYEEIGSVQNRFRRWALTLKNPCGPQRYVGRAQELAPAAGIQTIDLAPGANNLTVVASFTPPAQIVDYRVELTDSELPGAGTLRIHDAVGNITSIPITLNPVSDDEFLPVLGGSTNQTTFQFEGTATDNGPLDSGVGAITLAPYSDNLQIVSITPALPAGDVDYVVGLINPAANGRGYVRVEDVCGHREHIFVQIDALAPVLSGTLGRTKRYFSGPVDTAFLDNNPVGVSSNIVVSDSAVIADVNLTVNIDHGFAADIDLTMTSPLVLGLFSDIGSSVNDFIDTTLDDEAGAVIPQSGAPYTGTYRPEDGLLSSFDGNPANGTWTIKAVDDKVNDQGSFRNWSLLIESGQFGEGYDGRAQDVAPFDTGVCDIALGPGSSNLVLQVDPAFVDGARIVRYQVLLTPGACGGSGTVEVSDCAGNVSTVVIGLGLSLKGDLDDDGDIDLGDYELFDGCLAGPGVPIVGCGCYPADFDGDTDVDLEDFAGFMEAF
jgi:subtilisin-like proprotein convertase family protein